MRSALDIIRDLLELIGDDPDATLHLSVDTVADMRRVVAGSDGGRVMTIPLLRTLNAMVAGSEPRKRINCPACLDTGDTEYGRPCGWCALGHGPDDTDDEPSADEVERLRAIERRYWR
jgi:hypothetical protein